MSINEMMKLQGATPAKRLTSGEQSGAAAKSAAGAEKSPKPAASSQNGIAVEVSAKVGAGQPPVATDRVSEVRQALQDGSYPIVPAKIADAMIAARLSLTIEA